MAMYSDVFVSQIVLLMVTKANTDILQLNADLKTYRIFTQNYSLLGLRPLSRMI
jgi:hypothetical protein